MSPGLKRKEREGRGGGEAWRRHGKRGSKVDFAWPSYHYSWAERCCLVTTPFPFWDLFSPLYITFSQVRNGAVLHLEARRPGFI